jgi:hypothetical protein
MPTRRAFYAFGSFVVNTDLIYKFYVKKEVIRFSILASASCFVAATVGVTSLCLALRSMRRIENCDAVFRVYDEAGNAIETREHTGDFKEW